MMEDFRVGIFKRSIFLSGHDTYISAYQNNNHFLYQEIKMDKSN